MRSIVLRCVLVIFGALVAAAPAGAQSYPTKPVRILVGASPGGGTDIIARILAEKFSEAFKQSFVVENRPGASNTIAADLTAKAPPDGYTLLAATNTGQAIAPHLLKLGYDPLKGLQPVGLVVVVPNVLVVSESVPAKDVRELVALMKAKPNEFQYASSGIGSTQHIAGVGFTTVTGTNAVHVPYKGSSQAHADLITGRVQIMLDTTSSAMPQIKAGKLRPLAVTTAQRSAELPNVPTLAEAGYPGFEMSTWYGLFVTGGTPKPVVDRLASELDRILKLPDVQARLRALGGEPGAITVERFAEMNRAEYERMGKLIRDNNIKAEE
ncbi:MAG TPA: tripartite tricarboxylate transporter substrate binding protein [Casimicrobiaceae bacterium]|nr:tripartite tricarboxylate transporter substrate binding protein [Casimicrobiaceae bacterium]